jgi:surface carbohydrate biosynthesis protein
MAPRVDVVCLYEKAARELDVACVLKAMLEDKGWSVDVIQQNMGAYDAIRRPTPKLVLLPFCYQNRSNNLYLVAWREAAFFNLTWEQIYYPGNAVAKTPRGDFPLHHVVHHAWSEPYARLLESAGIPREHIFLNGSLPLALYADPYRAYFRTRTDLAEAYGLDEGRRWIFFPENYNWAFYDDGMLEQMVLDGQRPADVRLMRDSSNRSFESAVRWAAELVTGADVELVLRPRPSTNAAEFERRVREVLGSRPERLRVTQAGSAREWVLASDAVISSYSTTLIEAAVAGKPVFMLEPEPFPQVLQQDWYSLLDHVRSADEARTIPDRQESGAALGLWARESMLSATDPIERLVERLDGILSGRIAPPPSATRASVTIRRSHFIPTSILYEATKWKRRFFARLPSPFRTYHSRDVSEYRPDAAAQVEIPNRVKRWRQVLGIVGV